MSDHRRMFRPPDGSLGVAFAALVYRDHEGHPEAVTRYDDRHSSVTPSECATLAAMSLVPILPPHEKRRLAAVLLEEADREDPKPEGG